MVLIDRTCNSCKLHTIIFERTRSASAQLFQESHLQSESTMHQCVARSAQDSFKTTEPLLM